MTTLLALSAADVRRALPMREAIAAMRQAFGQLAAGRVDAPLRTALALPTERAVALVMPARGDTPLGVGAKLVSVVPQNPSRGLPLVHAVVVLLDEATGVPAALVEGTTLTAIRTGAASGLATDLLARPDASRMAVLGAGAQARTQLEAVSCVRRIAMATVYSRTRARAERFAEEAGVALGVPVRVADSARAAVREADIVCTATSAATPVLLAPDVAPGTHINAIGSYTPGMRELDPALVGRARVVVDQRAASLAEAGEVIAAVAAGLVSERDLIELGAVVIGAVQGRRGPDEITLFKSVGLAAQDLWAAAAAVAGARAGGLGIPVDLAGAP